MAELSPERQRALRRRHKHERQALIYGTLVAALALGGVGSAAVYTGVLDVPMLEREFTSPPPEETTAFPDPPCPADGTVPVGYNLIEVTVFNASQRAGLAGQTATGLTERGFVVLATGDYPAGLPVPAQISFGEAGLPAAYTLAANLDAPLLVLDTRADATVDLVLGESFSGLLDPTTVVLDPAVPLSPVSGCVPLEIAVASAVPPPARPPGAEPAEGEVPPEEQVEGEIPPEGGEVPEEAPPPEG